MSSDKDFKQLINHKDLAERMLDFCRINKINLNSMYNNDESLKQFKEEFNKFDTNEMIEEIKEANELYSSMQKDILEFDKKHADLKKDYDQLRNLIGILKELFEQKHYK